MKQVIGALILLPALRIWGLAVVDDHTLLRSGATLLVLALAFVGLVIAWFALFKDPRAGYDTRSGRRAQPRSDAGSGGLSELDSMVVLA